MKPSSESDQEDVRAQVEGIATLLKASIPPGKDIHGRPSPPSEKPQQCDCGRFPRVHDKGDLCDIGFNEFLGRVQGKLIDMGYEPPLWPEPHIRDCGDVDEALDVCVQWCAARLDEAKAAQSATPRIDRPLNQEGLDRASWEIQRHFGREGSIFGIKACEEIARIALVAYSRSDRTASKEGE